MEKKLPIPMTIPNDDDSRWHEGTFRNLRVTHADHYPSPIARRPLPVTCSLPTPTPTAVAAVAAVETAPAAQRHGHITIFDFCSSRYSYIETFERENKMYLDIDILKLSATE